MSDIVLKVENLSKQYRLGTVGTGTISHDLNRFFAKVRGKEDPYKLVGETNDRTSKSKSDYVWALKDINFELRKGEVLGIVGKNGAGKSTLLKILSRVTSSTTGKIKVKGRVGSLLEVGTGFHPELTGRENIYLNGSILGMRKWEIDKKLDEIVDFSGCERYLDTPVKRYSSGMKVRLGFSVAAHLEPEILVVDEVLAVGDVEFQKKCLGKMKAVSSSSGKTILFVSHNISSIKELCTKATLIENGNTKVIGGVDEVIEKYLINNKKSTSTQAYTGHIKRTKGLGSEIRVIGVNLILPNDSFLVGNLLDIELKVESKVKINDLSIVIAVQDIYRNNITVITSDEGGKLFSFEEGTISTVKVCLDKFYLNQGQYFLRVSLRKNKYLVDHIVDALSFEVTGIVADKSNFYEKLNCNVRSISQWTKGSEAYV
jgi:lipopolysaccharide transport system ATP-binding protein